MTKGAILAVRCRARCRRARSIDELAQAMRTLLEAMDPATTTGGWKLGEWPWPRRSLGRQYDTLQLKAAEMLEVATPPRSEWRRPGFSGGLYDNRTGGRIETALLAVGFDPLGVGEEGGHGPVPG